MTEVTTPTPTASQTIGPFPHEAWQWAVAGSAASGAAALTIAGHLLDGQGVPVNDGWIEAWMPGASAGAMPGFRRVATDETGRFELVLEARPAAGEPAAYITVFARGLVLHQNTVVFLADEAGAVRCSALLAQVSAERRASLLAVPEEAGAAGRYRWDIRLQGGPGEETVFFDYR